jgi:hypothetical protein
MGFEDAHLLAYLLSKSTSGDDLSSKMQLYERIRRPRVEKVNTLSNIFGAAWSAPDGEMVTMRNQRWKQAAAGYKVATPDGNAPLGSPNFMRWLDLWDPAKAVEDAIVAPVCA